jgi:hypothetical protein
MLTNDSLKVAEEIEGMGESKGQGTSQTIDKHRRRSQKVETGVAKKIKGMLKSESPRERMKE